MYEWQPNADELALKAFVKQLVGFRRAHASALASDELSWKIEGQCLTLNRQSATQLISGRFNLGTTAVAASATPAVLSVGVHEHQLLAGGFEVSIN